LEASFGLSLSHSLYYNVYHISEVKGYVISVALRLFTSWEGDNPLYLFAISTYSGYNITHRYPLNPKRNNTEWQIIEIPPRKFPIFVDYHLAIGMQDHSDTNQIYAVKSKVSIHGENITNSTEKFKAVGSFYSVAFIYTVFRNGKRIFYDDIFMYFFLFRGNLK